MEKVVYDLTNEVPTPIAKADVEHVSDLQKQEIKVRTNTTKVSLPTCTFNAEDTEDDNKHKATRDENEKWSRHPPILPKDVQFAQ